MTPHPTRSRIGSLSAFVGDDAFISAQGDTSSPFSTDVYLRDADHDPLTTLHLSPFAVRELRDALTRSLMALESATIEAAGIEVEATIPVTDDERCDVCGGTKRNHRGIPFTRRVPGSTFPAQNTSVTS